VNTTPQEQVIASITGAADNSAPHRPTSPEEAWP
jgi:D-xylose transport system ATP-binding protein